MLEADVIQSTLAHRDKFVSALFKRPDSFAQILPYEEYLKAAQMFVLKDGSLGAIFELSLIEHETLEAHKIIETIESLKAWFNLPENCTLQLLFDQSHIPARDHVWTENSFPDAHPFAARIHDARMATLRSFCEGANSLSPMKRRALLSIRYFPPKKSSRSILQILERGEGVLFGTMDEMTKEVSEFSQLLGQFTDSSKVKLSRVDGAALVDFLRRFFNPKEYLEREFAAFNPDRPISEQIVFAGPTGTLEGLEREGVKTRTITLKTSPRRITPGGTANFLNLNFPYRLSLNFSFPSVKKTKGYFDIKEFFLENSPSARSRRQRDELKQIQERLAHDERCLFMTFSVIIEGETDEILNRRARAITSVFHDDLDCEVIKEELIGLGLCLNSLPLFYTPASDHSSQRFIRIMNRDAAKLLPIFDSFRGFGDPLQMYLSRENNLVPFSSKSNLICNHAVYLGDTGSGKSKAALDYVQARKRKYPDELTFVVDKRTSCEELCKAFDGDLTVFDPKRGMPFSAFRGVFDDQKVNFLTNLILTAIRLTSVSFEMESHHISIASRSLKDAHHRKSREVGVVYRNGELLQMNSEFEVSVSMDDVIAAMSALTSEPEFEALKEPIEDMISRLMPFYGDGMYAPFFRGQEKRKKSEAKLLYAYDLDALDRDETLKVLMSMSVFNEIETMMSKPENQKRGGVFVLEELGCLGRDNPIVGRYAKEFTERMRKLGFDFIAVGPNPQIFFETEAGKAAWAAAMWFNFLKMSPDNVRYLAEKSSVLTPVGLQIVGSLETKDNEFSEIYVTSSDGLKKGALRFVQSNLDRETSANSERDRENLNLSVTR